MQSWNSSRNKRIPRVSLQRDEPKKSGMVRLIVMLVLVGIIVYFIYNSSFLKVNSIKISGVDQASANEVSDYILETFHNKKVYSVKEGYVTGLINQKFPNLKLDEVKYNFPNNFELNFSERNETYQVQASNGVFKVDNEGFVLGEAEEASPSAGFDVIYDKSLEVGKKIEDASLQAGLVYSELNQRIKIENDQIEFSLDDGGKVILPQNTAVAKVTDFYNILQKIIQKYTIDNRQIEFIDLRFQKPVIKYSD